MINKTYSRRNAVFILQIGCCPGVCIVRQEERRRTFHECSLKCSRLTEKSKKDPRGETTLTHHVVALGVVEQALACFSRVTR